VAGITRGTTAGHLARATLEGIAFQVRDLLHAMSEDGKQAITRLRVDGGAAANDLLLQFQADVAEIGVDRPAELESTGRGAAMLAGVGAGLCSLDATRRMLHVAKRFEPKMDGVERARHLARWQDAVKRTRTSA
jgi:glycerol kinase